MNHSTVIGEPHTLPSDYCTHVFQTRTVCGELHQYLVSDYRYSSTGGRFVFDNLYAVIGSAHYIWNPDYPQPIVTNLHALSTVHHTVSNLPDYTMFVIHIITLRADPRPSRAEHVVDQIGHGDEIHGVQLMLPTVSGPGRPH
jgi:hypothetical protein